MLAERAKACGGRLYYDDEPQLVQLVERRLDALSLRLSQFGGDTQRHAILFHRTALFRDTQAKIHFHQEPAQGLVFLLLFELCDNQIQLLDDSWVIHPEQWRAAPLRNNCYRCFHLLPDKLQRLTLTQCEPVVEDMDIAVPARKDEEMEVEPPRPIPLTVSRDSLCQLLPPMSGGSAARYTQLLLDHSLRRKFDVDVLSEYAAYCADMPAHSHGEAMLGVLYGAVQHCDDPRQLHRLLDEVRALECARLRADPPDATQLSLYGFIYRVLPRAPVWLTAYCLGRPGIYWQCDGDKYNVHAAWVCQMDLSAMPTLHQGLLVLSEHEFAHHFVPTFYSQLLVDLFNYLVRLRLERVDYADELCALDRLHTALHRTTLDGYVWRGGYDARARLDEFYRTLPLGGVLSAVYDWSVEYGCPGTLTVQQALQRLSRCTGVRSLTFERAALPDIEALVDGDFLPPCLAAVLGRDVGHLKNYDRLDATAYLAEMQYEREEVVAYLGRANDPRDIATNYQTYMRRAQDKKAARASPYCDTVISRSRNAESLLACPYQPRLSVSGSSDDPKKSCRDQCAAACSPTYQGALLHPLDFVAERLNKFAQNK